MAEYTCCSSVAFEPNESTFTFTFTYVAVLSVAGPAGAGGPGPSPSAATGPGASSGALLRHPSGAAFAPENKGIAAVRRFVGIRGSAEGAQRTWSP
jgi:hypothetical protein